jgi:hypothetical protein
VERILIKNCKRKKTKTMGIKFDRKNPKRMKFEEKN